MADEKELREMSERLRHALQGLVAGGTKINKKKGVPYYWCDPDDPRIIIRELNGEIERGTMEKTEFVPISKKSQAQED